MTTSSRSRLKGLFWLWSGYLGGAIAWSLFHLVSYLWATIAWGVPARPLIIATTAGMAALTGAATWMCYQAWREASRGDDRVADHQEEAGTLRYLALSGMYLNAFFLLSILLSGMSVFFLSPLE
jgi:hypothetical protein